MELILEKYPNLNFDWLLTGKGNMHRMQLIPQDHQFNDINYKELADTRKELIGYKDLEIQQLKKMIEELKKAKEPTLYPGMVAEPTEKLK